MALKIGTIKRKPGIIWTGSFFTKNNYAKINQQILNKLSQTGEYDIGIFVDDEFNRSPGILPPLLESKIGKIPPIIEFQIFHQILPQLEPPSKGRWIIMQPWEYGSIPITWLEAINLSIDEIWVYSNTNKENYILDGVDEKKLQVIPLGIDPKIYNPDVKPMKLSTNKNFKFLFVGETMWYTGIDLVLQAFTEEFLFDEDVCLIIKDFQSSSPTARRNNIETIKKH